MTQKLPSRRSIRLKDFDYAAPGGYFITLCTHNRKPLFGEIACGAMLLNECGLAVQAAWGELAGHYPHVTVDEFAVMPNHLHGILVLGADEENARAARRPAPTNAIRQGVPVIVRTFKTFSAKTVNAACNTPGAAVWQRGYFERVIRGDESLGCVREYIRQNPARWADDDENPSSRRFRVSAK